LWYGTLAEVMRSVHGVEDINLMLSHVISRLSTIAKLGNLSYISKVMTYFFEVGEMRDRKEFNKIMKHNFTKKVESKIMTYAEQLRVEGRVEGRSEGKMEATRNVAIRLLQRDSKPEVVASITELPLAQVLKLKKEVLTRGK